MNNKKNWEIKSKEAKKLTKDWQNCLPGNLSNLFYYDSDKDGIQRIKYFLLKLGKEDKEVISAINRNDVHCIRIYMGCSKKEKFAPIFTIVIKDDKKLKKLFFSLDLPDNQENGLYTPKAFPAITRGITDLLQKNWEELSDLDLAESFSGATLKNTKQPAFKDDGEPNLKAYRVKSYDFPEADAKKVIEYIQDVINNPEFDPLDVRLCFGAGLIVHLSHPFSFRPILFTASLPTSGEDVPGGNCYERSKPCPPYCDDDEGL